MNNVVTPAPMVAKAEVDGEIRKLSTAIGHQWKAQREAQDRADIHGLEIGRLICEHAEKPDVKAKLTIANAKENKPSGGRPKAAHCWVAEQVIQCGSVGGLSLRHLERCARAFMKAKAKGLPLNASIRIAEASAVATKYSDKALDDCQPSPERLFNSENDSSDPDEEFDPEREAMVLARKVKTFFYSETGNPRFRTQKQRDQFANTLNKAFAQMRLGWSVIPNGKE